MCFGLVAFNAFAECPGDTYVVKLIAPGGAKLNVVKAVKSLTGLGLKEAKDLVDLAPVILKKKLSLSTAQAWKSALKQAGATARIKGPKGCSPK
jgi:large subunit ribosomal protein L7/L12